MLLAVLLIVVAFSRTERVNRFLALYVFVCLIWSMTALTGRVLTTSDIIPHIVENDPRVFPLVYIVLITLTGNSPFFYAFALEYVGLWENRRLQAGFWICLAATVFGASLALISPSSMISNYSITSVGMITIEPQAIALPMIAFSYFFWYAVAIYLLWRHRWPQSKWVVIGALAVSMGLAIEIVTAISDILPLANLATGFGACAFVYSVLQDSVFSPLRSQNEELKRSRQSLEQIISGIPGGVIISDGNGKVLWSNEQAQQTLLIDEVEMKKRPVSAFYANPADLETVRERLKRDGFIENFDFQLNSGDGAKRWARLQMVPIEYEGGNAVLGIAQDIHELKQAEASLMQMQKWESQAVLAGGIAHDFNNLLVAMLGQASVAKAKMDEANPGYKHITRVESAARRAAALTKQMLAYSGQGAFSIQKVDINSIIEDNLSLFAVSIPKQIVFDTKFDTDLPKIEADKTQIQQVIMNLIINAVHAIGENSGTITVCTGVTAQPDLSKGQWMQTQEAPLSGTYVFFEVADSGIGIEQSKIEQIFEPFYTTRVGGNGLGLAAVLGIVRGHNGAIQVMSEAGEGTCFQIFLPAIIEVEEERVSAETKETYAGNPVQA